MTNRFKAIAGITGIFLLGGFCGALLFGLIIRNNVRERQGLRDHDGFISYFERRLQLSEAQRDSLRDELEFTYNRLAELRQATSEQYNAVIDTMSQRISPQLTPEQRELFNQQEQNLRHMMPKERAAQHLAGHGPGGPLLPRPAAPQAEEPAPQSPAGADRMNGSGGKLAAAPQSISPAMPSRPASPIDSSREPEPFPQGIDQLKKMLDLSNDQVTQVTAALAETKSQNDKARADLADRPGLKAVTIRGNNQELRRKVLALLSDSQRQKFQAIRMQRKRETSK